MNARGLRERRTTSVPPRPQGRCSILAPIRGSRRVQGSYGVDYALSEPAITFAWLDTYEGIKGADRDEYRRCRRTVTQVDGTELVAWVYIFVRSADGIRAIASGDWLIG